MEIPHELVNAIVRGDAVLFIGAGLSIDAGLPGWNELLEPLANSISLPMALRADPLKVAQYYQNKRGRNALLNHPCFQLSQFCFNRFRLDRNQVSGLVKQAQPGGFLAEIFAGPWAQPQL